MLNFVPFARSWREMADRQGQACLIGQPLQLPFPKSQSIAIASPAVCGDQQLSRVRIQPVTFGTPPTTNRCHREGTRVVVRS